MKVQKIKMDGRALYRRALAALATLATCGGLMAAEYNGVVYATDGEIVPGQWNSQFAKAKAQADATDTPLVVVWANPGCGQCKRTEEAMATSEFTDWMEERGYLFVFALGSDTKDGSAAKSFARSPSREYPYVGVYWGRGLDNNAKPNPFKFTGRSGKMPVKQGTLVQQLTASVDRLVGSYEAGFVGGGFDIEESEFHRLEAEAGTTTVPVTLTRRETAAAKETHARIHVILPDGTTATNEVNWTAASGTTQTINVAIATNAFAKAGEQIRLVLVDDEGEEQDATHITFVETENSSHNPLWIGETPEQGLEFGMWTMDLDAAKALAKGAEGDAFTLALVQGALWCPDCAGVYDNFLSVTNAAGENVFAAWARSNQVALVSIDVPRFNTNTVESTSPTLLSRELRTGGLDPKERSGLGYLSRKGVTDEAAAAVLERNRLLVSQNTAEGGFHRPENANPYRTGVPMFVMLRKDGTVAARLTRFSDMGRETTAEKWGDYIKRFDEMRALAMGGAHADDVENNDAASTKAELVANGGTVEGELSHADAADVFRLTGTTGASVQRVRISGEAAATVTLQCYALDDAGRAVAVGAAKKVSLPGGDTIETTFAEAGEHFVKVSVDHTAGAFDVASGTAENFVAYTLAGEVAVFVPAEAVATGAAAAGTTEVTVRLEAGMNYWFEGVASEANADVLKRAVEVGTGAVYTAQASGDQTIKLTGESFAYRKWLPGTVAFGETANSVEVSENAGSWTIPVVRTDGVSGDVTVKIAVNAAETTLVTSEGEARYEFAEQTVTWRDGEATATNVVVRLRDDARFDGDGQIVLEMTRVVGVAALGATKYVLTVRENEKAEAGSIGFTGAEPFFARPNTVYVKAGEGATVFAARSARNDGAVSATIKPSVATAVVEVDGVATNVIAWGNHDSSPVEVKVTGLQVGKTVRVTLSQPRNGAKLTSGATAVSVVAVADDAPEFAETARELSLVRYVAAREEIALKEGTYAPTNRIAVTKLTGSLPAGVTAKWDATLGRLVVLGVPTAKAGSYRATFQVTETRARRATPGLTMELAITVVDSAVASAGGAALNPAVAASRTFKAIPLVYEGRELVGTLDVTIPATGRVSAKYVSATGTVSFSARNWAESAEDGTLVAEAASRGYALRVAAVPTGAVQVELVDPSLPGATLMAEIAGTVWSRTNPATPWVGYYTMAMKPNRFVEAVEGVAPRGSGYLTLTMSASDARTGTVRYSGMLANGTTVSGSSTLTDLGEGRAALAIFKKASKNVFAALLEMRTEEYAESCGQPAARIVPAELCETAAYLVHTETVALGSYDVGYDTYGNLYDGKDLAGCCEEGYETDAPKLSFDIGGLGGWTANGAPQAFDDLTVNVTSSTMALAGRAVNPVNPQSVTFSFTARTGVVRGAFYLPCETATGTRRVRVNYQGVVVTGWGEGCGCSETAPVPEFLPFVNGAYYFTDKVGYEVETRPGTVVSRQLSVQRGGAVQVDR